MAVIQHRSVDDSRCVFGEMLQVLVVRCDYTKTLMLVEAVEQGFGNGASDLRFRTASEFIY